MNAPCCPSDTLTDIRQVSGAKVAVLQTFDMKFDRFLNQYNDFLPSLCSGNAPGQIRYVSPKSIVTLFHNHEIFHSRYFSPACLRMLLRVPGGMSMPGCPETVTVPGFVGCLNCLWLPRVLFSTQPSFSKIRSTALTFVRPECQGDRGSA
jgi:hypothetical protein